LSASKAGIPTRADIYITSRWTEPTFTGGGVTTTGSPLLTLAAVIAQTHHERWDGTGYPLGLKGEDIPIEGRITAVADVFDALCSARPYKPAFPLEKCLSTIQEESGHHFDPRIAEVFLSAKDEVVRIMQTYAD